MNPGDFEEFISFHEMYGGRSYMTCICGWSEVNDPGTVEYHIVTEWEKFK